MLDPPGLGVMRFIPFTTRHLHSMHTLGPESVCAVPTYVYCIMHVYDALRVQSAGLAVTLSSV